MGMETSVIIIGGSTIGAGAATTGEMEEGAIILTQISRRR